MNEKKEVLDNANTYDLIKRSNDLIKTITLKQKEYAPVNERVMAFRRVHPLGQIITEPTFTDNYVMYEAVVLGDDDKVLSKGHAREYLKTEFAFEKAETSAIGRALGFCGYGISTSISSFEDMENVDKPSEIFDEPSKEKLVEDFNRMLNQQERVDFLNAIHVVDPNKISSKLLIALLEFKDEKYSTK